MTTDAETLPVIEFHQQDWMPGFAAFVDDGRSFAPGSKAFCLLNLGAMLAMVETRDIQKADLPYFVAECMMHEIMHVLEKWAGTEFSEERVEAMLETYRAAAQSDLERG